jgi:DNA invertase Pin-like site-specific DNA recombinase
MESYISPARRRVLEGRASDFLELADIRPGVKVVLCCRVSTPAQEYRGNGKDQEVNLRKIVEQVGGEVVGVGHHTGKGFDPRWLLPVAALARRLGAILLAESADRYLRSFSYHSSRNPNSQPMLRDFEELRWLLGGVTAATVLHPDGTPRKVRSYQRRRGQRAKGRSCGRPVMRAAGYKKERLLQLRPRAVELRRSGMSIREVAAKLDVPVMTCWRWVR